jgi:hypothetical protein
LLDTILFEPILFEDKSPILHVTLSARMGGVGMSETYRLLE